MSTSQTPHMTPEPERLTSLVLTYSATIREPFEFVLTASNRGVREFGCTTARLVNVENILADVALTAAMTLDAGKQVGAQLVTVVGIEVSVNPLDLVAFESHYQLASLHSHRPVTSLLGRRHHGTAATGYVDHAPSLQ